MALKEEVCAVEQTHDSSIVGSPDLSSAQNTIISSNHTGAAEPQPGSSKENKPGKEDNVRSYGTFNNSNQLFPFSNYIVRHRPILHAIYPCVPTDPPLPNSQPTDNFDANLYCIQLEQIIQKLRPESIFLTVNKVRALGVIYHREQIYLLMHVVTEHAIRNFHLAPVYVDFLKNIREIEPVNLVAYCQLVFNNQLMVFDRFMSPVHRARCLGIVRFLGVMYLYELLSIDDASQFAVALYDFSKDCRMECFFEFVAVMNSRIGRKHEYIRFSPFVDQLLTMLKPVLGAEGFAVSSATKARLEYLCEHRDGKAMLILGEFIGDVNDVLEGYARRCTKENVPNPNANRSNKHTIRKNPY